MLPTKLAFVDLETTGTRPTYDRVIEIGIVQTQRGEIVDTYSTLINPGGILPLEIEKITGITTKDVSSAPPFQEVASEILTRLKDYTFVAHNVRFDYGFLKAEFARIEKSFSPKHFCTVRLSRALFPQEYHHNLDAIINRFQLSVENRHRALYDAMAITSFYHKAKEMVGEDVFEEALKKVLKKPSLPLNLDPRILENLPETAGVYIFYGATDIPLYIGKSINVKERVLSHFSGDIRSPLEMKISQQIQSLETIATAGELGALFLESQLIKAKMPLYNRMLRQRKELMVLRQKEDAEGYLTVKPEVFTGEETDNLSSIVGIFRSKKQMNDHLYTLAKEHLLCEKLLNIEKTSKSCFGYRLGRCKGACIGREIPLSYNMRFIEGFTETKIKRWPFDGPIIIEERDEICDKKEFFLVNNWCLLESATTDSFDSFDHKQNNYIFDLDMYKILVRFILQTKNSAKIHPLPLKEDGM
ncbi:MAG: ethanolamine utilization protein [Candidatus Levybacteria bacterium]|nr:ethanolamine utilization protein [Candidatus Levybacteria bacterium]